MMLDRKDKDSTVWCHCLPYVFTLEQKFLLLEEEQGKHPVCDHLTDWSEKMADGTETDAVVVVVGMCRCERG